MDSLSISQRLKTARSVFNLRQGRNDWYRMRNNATGVAEIWIYDEIGYFGVSAADFIKDLNGLSASSIDLHINSPGGDVFDGLAIYNSLRNHKATVITHIDGLAASAASFIAMAGNEVVIMRNAEMMIHDAHGICIGNAADMRELAELMDKNSDNIADIYAQKAGGTVDEWRDRMRAETWYVGNEAKEAGLADRVQDGGETSNSWDLSIFAHSGRRDAPAPSPVTKSSEPEPFEFDFEMIQRALKEAWK